MKNQTFEYNGTPITFQLGNGDLLLNATQMAKPFGKRTPDWLSTKQARELISTLSAKTGIPVLELVSVNQGGNNPGTWLYQDLALVFAQWLSPEFYLWCNDRIKELLKYGFTASPATIESMIADPDNAIRLLTELKEERHARQLLEEQADLYKQSLERQAPKVKYHDQVLMSESTYNSNQIAKELGMSAITFHRILQRNKVMYKQRGQWLLMAKYQDKEYTKTHTHTFHHSDGTPGTSMQTVWTEKGRLFIHELFTGLLNN